MSKSLIEQAWNGKCEYARVDRFGNVIGTGTYNFDDEIDEDGSGPADEREIEDAEDADADAPEGFDSVESLDG